MPQAMSGPLFGTLISATGTAACRFRATLLGSPRFRAVVTALCIQQTAPQVHSFHSHSSPTTGVQVHLAAK